VNDVCTQDCTNARGVNTPVVGSLRVRQPYGDEDEIRVIGSGVGINNNPTRSFGTDRSVEETRRLERIGR